MPWLLVVLAWAAALAPCAEARKPKPVPCADGRFLVQNAPIAIGSTIAVSAMVIANGSLQLVGACSAPIKLKVSKAGSKFKVAATCTGIAKKVRVTGAFDTACDVVTGTVKAKKAPKTSFTAKRSRCPDGILDPGAGEQCERGIACAVGSCDTTTCLCSGGSTTTTTTIVGNQPPTVGAGLDLAVTLPAGATLDGTVSDDGLPNPPATVTTAWSKSSGPGTVTFSDAAAVDTQATFSDAGTYVLRLTASDGQLSAFDETTVVVTAASNGDAKTVVLDAVEAKMSTFDGTDQDQENRDMLAFVQGRGEFTASGLSEDGGAVWARFSDGTTLVIGNNLVADKPFGGAATALTRRASPRVPHARDAGIPETLNVVLGASLGSFYEGVNEDIAEMFNTQVYTRVQPDSSVDALKTLQDVAVLYLNAHGATVRLHTGATPQYTIWTSTVRARDGSTDRPYVDDLRDDSLTFYTSFAYDPDDGPTGIRRHPETHYAITANFVRKYWPGKFATSSMVFMNACRSASVAALEFEIACLEAGASVYFGWTDRVRGGDAAVSAAFLFDRMLGTNSDKLPMENPPQRAFPYIDVLGEMETRQRPNQPYPLDTSVHPTTHVPAYLMPFAQDTEFALLAPSIHDLAVNEEKDELAINGDFGDVKGEVQISGFNVTVKTWDTYSIVVDLPRSGPSSSGDVKVTVNSAQFSNTVPLTAWHGTATYTLAEAGTLTMVMHFDIRFRGDVHRHRDVPGEMPAPVGLAFNHALLTSGTYEFSGRYEDPPNLHYTQEWSGGGTLTSFPNTAAPSSQDNTVSLVGTIGDGKWDMNIQAFATKGNHIHSFQISTQGMVIADTRYDADGFVPNFAPPGSQFQGSVNELFDIAGGTRVEIVDSAFGGGNKATHTLEWSEFSAESSPNSDTAAALAPSMCRTLSN